jgi:hypothetical protein
MCNFEIPDVEKLPATVFEFAREWKRLRARISLVELEDELSDEAHDELMGKALGCRTAIENRLTNLRPETIHDCADLVDIALAILSEGGSGDELEMLKIARKWMVQLGPENQYAEAA